MVVSGVSRLGASAVQARRAAGPAGFGLRAERSGGAAASIPTAGVAIASLLAMQEAGSEQEREQRQDRAARQHGEAVIDELSALQRALLGSDGPDLARLSELAERPVAAADPGLAGVLRAIRLRAQVELARHGRAATE